MNVMRLVVALTISVAWSAPAAAQRYTATESGDVIELVDTNAQMNVSVDSLAVQSTTLDDVFVHYTGRALRDGLQEASAQDSPFMIRR